MWTLSERKTHCCMVLYSIFFKGKFPYSKWLQIELLWEAKNSEERFKNRFWVVQKLSQS